MAHSPRSARYRFSVRAAAIAMVILMLFGVAEGGARLAYALQGQIKSTLGLRPHLENAKMWDQNHPELWRLRPGFTMTLQERIAQEDAAGRAHSVLYLEKMAQQAGMQSDAVFLGSFWG